MSKQSDKIKQEVITIPRTFSPAVSHFGGNELRDSFQAEVAQRVTDERRKNEKDEITLYHVVGQRWSDGKDLLCYELLDDASKDGRLLGDDSPDHDTDVISFHWTLDEAKKWRDEFRPECRILRADIPLDIEVVANNEGNPSVKNRVIAAFLSIEK